MTERYDGETAAHYAAYRPPLHERILEGLVESDEEFSSGLDLGCGTGCSSVALRKYCERVCGVEVSREMLELARAHEGITYHVGSAGDLERLPGNPFDVVSFAGSMFYTKSPALRKSLQ